MGASLGRRILVALDGSVPEGALLRRVRVLAEEGSEILLLRVENPLAAPGSEPAVFAAAQEGARQYLRKLCDELQPVGARVRLLTRIGGAVSTIVSVARRENVSLIALATHGRKGLSRLIRGSVTEQVLRLSPAPVLVFRPGGPGERREAGEIRFENLLLPTNGTPESKVVLEAAFDLGRTFGGRIIFLRAVPTNLRDQRRERVQAEQDLAALSQKARHLGLRVVERIVPAPSPASAILEACRTFPIDLIAMVTRGRSGLHRWVEGSVTESVIRDTPVPVLVVRAPVPAVDVAGADRRRLEGVS